MTDIKLGSVVRLNSGGPPMTITQDLGGDVPATRKYRCDWMDGCVAKAVDGTHYAMVGACIAYTDEIGGPARHSYFCGIIEPVIQDGGWRAALCPAFNDAD